MTLDYVASELLAIFRRFVGISAVITPNDFRNEHNYSIVSRLSFAFWGRKVA